VPTVLMLVAVAVVIVVTVVVGMNRIFWLLLKHGAFPCSATLRECQTNQMPDRS